MRIHDKTSLIGSPSMGAAESSRAPSTKRAAMKEVEVRFGAALLDAALPKGKASFGAALAGSVAREKLIDQIARMVAEKGGLRIARLADEPAAAKRAQTD